MRAAPFALLMLAAAWIACVAPSDPAGEDPKDDPSSLEWADAGIPERSDAGPEPEIEVCFAVTRLSDDQLPRCTAQTRDCVAACPADTAGEACRNDCWGTDPTPPITVVTQGEIGCDDCVFRSLLSCIDTADNGICHGPVAAYLCCLLAGGVGCEDETNEMFTCGFVTAPECFELTSGEIGRCYATSDEPENPDGGP
jgi:hypothetical protein